MISFLCFAHPFTSTQNALCLPILARLNQAHSSGPRPTVTSSTKLFQHFPTPSSPSFELPQHFNHLSKIACITIYYIFLTYRPRFSTLAGLTFLGYIIIFFMRAVLCISSISSLYPLDVSSITPSITTAKYAFRYCHVSLEEKTTLASAANHCFRWREVHEQKLCFFFFLTPYTQEY